MSSIWCMILVHFAQFNMSVDDVAIPLYQYLSSSGNANLNELQVSQKCFSDCSHSFCNLFRAIKAANIFLTRILNCLLFNTTHSLVFPHFFFFFNLRARFSLFIGWVSSDFVSNYIFFFVIYLNSVLISSVYKFPLKAEIFCQY